VCSPPILPLVGAVDISPQFYEGTDSLQVPPESCYVQGGLANLHSTERQGQRRQRAAAQLGGGKEVHCCSLGCST
jgi:hypothetical protein